MSTTNKRTSIDDNSVPTRVGESLTTAAWTASSPSVVDTGGGRVSTSNEDDDNTFPEPDYGDLDLAFEETIEFESALVNTSLSHTSSATDDENDDLSPSCKKNQPLEEEDEDYILGTLIVRVVAARDLTPVPSENGRGFGSLLGFQRSSSPRRRRNRNDGTSGANPYASVRFGKTIQRTSQLFDTTDPTWPRGEDMFMDVTHPSPSKEKENASTGLGLDESHDSDPTPHAHHQHNVDFSRKSPDFVNDAEHRVPRPERPVLTVAIFHTHSASGNNTKHYPSKKGNGGSGDSDDVFLGMAAVDLTTLLTGKQQSVDVWLALAGGALQEDALADSSLTSSCGSVRIVCEYEASSAKPRQGDWVQFTGYCRPADLYPLHHHQWYKVMENDPVRSEPSGGGPAVVPAGGNEVDDFVTISYTTIPEGWVCSTAVHRSVLMICEERSAQSNRFANVLEVCQDEFVSLGQRLSRSPLVHVVQDSIVHKIPDEGLVSLGVAAFTGGGSLLKRWMREGVHTAVQDVMHATNLDGHNDPPSPPSAEESLATDSDDEFFEAAETESARINIVDESLPQDVNTQGGSKWEALPNMPSCPITGEPMREPVVAADGHTYERSAIARWLQTSDKSPLTGSVLTHKNLVPNYMLVSSLQDSSKQASDDGATQDQSVDSGNGDGRMQPGDSGGNSDEMEDQDLA